MHPDAAAAESFADGEPVFIKTQPRRVRQKACFSDSLNPQAVCADFGRWFVEPGSFELHGSGKGPLSTGSLVIRR